MVDAAMVDGAASLMTMTYTLRSAGIWQDERATNLLDTGAHFYEVYETSDGGYIGGGGHRAPVLRRADAACSAWGARTCPTQMDRDRLAGHEGALRRHLRHPDPRRVGGGLRRHRRLRGPGAVARPRRPAIPTTGPGAPSPRWPGSSSRRPPRASVGTPGAIRRPPPNPGQHGDEALADWGVADRRGRRAADVGRHPLTARPARSGAPAQRLTTGQVTVRMMPSMSWIRPTTIWPSSSTVPASARAITS